MTVLDESLEITLLGKGNKVPDAENADATTCPTQPADRGAAEGLSTVGPEVQKRFSYRLNNTFLLISMPSSFIILVCILYYYFTTKNALIVARVVSGYCMIFTLLITGLLVYLHLCFYTKPREQRYIIRILFMAPIYSVDSFIALWKTQSAEIISLIRDTYESYVLYMFVQLLLEYLGGEKEALKSLRQHKPEMSHLFPFSWLKPIRFTSKTFFWWKVWLLQYFLIKPIVTCLAVCFTWSEHYKEGYLSWSNAWVYLSMITNFSVLGAFTVVLYMYQATKELLAQHNPFGKFLAIKSVVFVIFWQSVTLDVLVHMGWLRVVEIANPEWTSEMVASAFQDMLVCIEMALLAVMHRYVFGFDQYLLSSSDELTWDKVTHVLSQSDVVHDVVHLLPASTAKEVESNT